MLLRNLPVLAVILTAPLWASVMLYTYAELAWAEDVDVC